MDKSFDTQFSAVNNNLKWKPFVGDKYLSIPQENRILLIGESHYLNPNSLESIEKVDKNKECTRNVIKWGGIDGDKVKNRKDIKFFTNLNSALFRGNKFDKNKFWENVSFYNFIQKPMQGKKARPNKKNYEESFATFFELIAILKPSVCIFIGTGASNSFNKMISKEKIYSTSKSLKRDKKISRTYPRQARIEDKKGNEIKIIFIQHVSQYFSWKKWYDYLKSEDILKDELTWLESKLD